MNTNLKNIIFIMVYNLKYLFYFCAFQNKISVTMCNNYIIF